jgi:glycosyltransferase involved in cell wall biosynthesis
MSGDVVGNPVAVTAIIPLKHCHEPYLRAALRSLTEQTSPDWRGLIVVEPADRRRFHALLAPELADRRLALIVNRGRQLAGAINTGMHAATSAFVALLLGDDLWAPEAVAVLTAAIHAHPDTDFFHSARRVIDGEGRPLSSVHRSRADFALSEFVGGSPVKHLLCWRRTKGLAVGGLDESLNSVGPDDYDFPWTMAEHGARFTAIEECLYIYRDHRDGFRLTTHLTLPHHLRELDRILAKHGVDSAERARRLAAARRGFLRQCLYRSRADRWWQRLRGVSPRSGWRETYR